MVNAIPSPALSEETPVNEQNLLYDRATVTGNHIPAAAPWQAEFAAAADWQAQMQAGWHNGKAGPNVHTNVNINVTTNVNVTPTNATRNTFSSPISSSEKRKELRERGETVSYVKLVGDLIRNALPEHLPGTPITEPKRYSPVYLPPDQQKVVNVE